MVGPTRINRPLGGARLACMLSPRGWKQHFLCANESRRSAAEGRRVLHKRGVEVSVKVSLLKGNREDATAVTQAQLILVQSQLHTHAAARGARRKISSTSSESISIK